MKTYSKKAIEFINKYVLEKMNFKEITEDNISEIVNFIIDNYEVPLAQAEEAGDVIDKELLDLATSVVTEITSDPEW